MAEQTAEPRARLAYVLGQFPSVSETFILREIIALERLGFHITPLSLQPGAGVVHAAARPLAERTVYRPHPFSGPGIAALFGAFFNKPFGCLSALWLVMHHTVREPRAFRELLNAYAAACYFVANVPPGQMRHIHAHFATFPATVGLILAEILGVGLSISCHARDIFTNEARLLQVKLSETEFLTVCTEYGADMLKRKHSIMNLDRLKVIRHGLDLSEFRDLKHTEYRVPLIVSVGRMVEKKGFPILLRAAAMLAAEGVEFELALIGDGPQRDELERLANGLGLSHKVYFPGYLPFEEVLGTYRYADVFALTPIVAHDGDRDGLPNAIVEAMACGVPVVATNVGGVPELVEHEVTGLLAQPGNVQEIAQHLERALIDQPLREKIAANAWQRVIRDHDADKNAFVLGSVFAELLKLRKWPPGPDAGSPPADGEDVVPE